MYTTNLGVCNAKTDLLGKISREEKFWYSRGDHDIIILNYESHRPAQQMTLYTHLQAMLICH